ncbi:GumC family protein [Carboxylicivirga marina]|uniref:GumC family protein n=1 Tax=Carboxylicivirga marina TaxID=2800988 RepID=UPI00259A1C50|nr:tyrosine-protein kinase family protein [uncultured Carboxylicivirga sp.]
MFDDKQRFDDQPINFRKYFYRILSYWYYCFISLFISVVAAYYVYQSTPELYMVSAKLLIKGNQDQVPTVGSASENTLPGINLGMINNIENQLIILRSSRQLEKVLKHLDFAVSYYKEGKIKSTEIYKDCPFVVKLDTIGVELLENDVFVDFDDRGRFKLEVNGIEYADEYKFYEQIKVGGLGFSIIPREGQKIENVNNYNYRFTTRPSKSQILFYQYNTNISEVKSGSSVFEISIQENNKQKGIDFINTLAENAVSYNLDKKNQVAINTIKFIDNQLVDVSDSLNMTKAMLEKFRTQNEMVDISMQGQMIIDKTETLQFEKDIVSRQLDYYKYLVNFLEGNADILNLLPPSGQGVENQVLDQMVTELSAMNAEKQSLQFNSKEGNPAIARINRQIEAHKQNILQQANGNVTSSQKDIDELDRRLLQLGFEVRRLPKKEQVSLEIEKKFQTTDRLYNYLLEKRSEAQLAKAANISDNEIIEQARVIKQTQPNIKSLVIIVIVMGLLLPVGIIFLLIFLNNKVQDKDDLEEILEVPVLGTIPQMKDRKKVLNNQFQPIFSEAIRNIRTSIEFYPIKTGSKCILISSGLPNEGKSSLAISLAISYAQLRKRVVVIDFDMRKPKISHLMELKANGYGLSSFLAQYNTQELHKLIHSNEDYSLDIIPSGLIPPNPAELIAGEQTHLLLNELKNLYDVIIIDSPPIGLVTDAQLLSRLVDINILVARHNKTPIPMLRNLFKDPKVKAMEHLSVVLNDLPVKKRAYNNYSYDGKYYSN